MGLVTANVKLSFAAVYADCEATGNSICQERRHFRIAITALPSLSAAACSAMTAALRAKDCAVSRGASRKHDTITIRGGSSVRASDLASVGVRVYDPGYVNTQACSSAITFLDGDAGVLRYRGYDIAHVAASATFPEVAFLLIYGDLPDAGQLAQFDAALVRHAALPAVCLDVIHALPQNAHPMNILAAAFSAMGAAFPNLNPSLTSTDLYQHSVAAREAAVFAVLGSFPALVAAIYRRVVGLHPVAVQLPTSQTMSYAERLLYLINGHQPSNAESATVIARALDALLILHADHELNCSTAVLRQLSSSGVDLFTCIAGAIGALYGPLHGGATEAVLKMLRRIDRIEAVPSFIDGVKARKEKLMGFGHRVYKNFDPRAKIVRNLAHQVFRAVDRVEPLITVATALEKEALSDQYFIERKLYPNIDFYTGLIYQAIGFPAELFPVLFALGRSAGWVAHWLEFLDDSDRRIARPQQLYVGHVLRQYVDISERQPSSRTPTRATLATPKTLARL